MTAPFAPTRLRAAAPLLALSLALSLAGCSSFENLMSGDKVDYRGSAQKTAPLEVPPDLSQLAREGRYQPQTGVVSASTLRQPNAPQQAAAAAVVAPNAVADMRIERQGNTRWLVTGTDERAMVCARFDNLGKGASGAAIQCMNLMRGLSAQTGLNGSFT